jgi:hypothetical protein
MPARGRPVKDPRPLREKRRDYYLSRREELLEKAHEKYETIKPRRVRISEDEKKEFFNSIDKNNLNEFSRVTKKVDYIKSLYDSKFGVVPSFSTGYKYYCQYFRAKEQ